MNWATKQTGNKDVAADIVQNFWLIFWSKPYAIKTDEEGNARKYLIHYFTYRMFDYLRTSAAKSLGNDFLLEQLSQTKSYSHIIENIQVEEILTVIESILQAFPYMTQQIFKEVWENNRSVKETAKELGVSEKVVRNHHKKVLDSIQNKVQNLFNENDLNSHKAVLKIIVLLGVLI